jgi:hypothetical protein
LVLPISSLGLNACSTTTTTGTGQHFHAAVIGQTVVGHTDDSWPDDDDDPVAANRDWYQMND